MKQDSLNQQHYERELRRMLAEPETRIFLWRLIAEDCRVFVTDFQHNATAYSLLAVQRLGKILLEDMKRIDASAVYQAEQEYCDLKRRSDEQKQRENKEDGTIY